MQVRLHKSTLCHSTKAQSASKTEGNRGPEERGGANALFLVGRQLLAILNRHCITLDKLA